MSEDFLEQMIKERLADYDVLKEKYAELQVRFSMLSEAICLCDVEREVEKEYQRMLWESKRITDDEYEELLNGGGSDDE